MEKLSKMQKEILIWLLNHPPEIKPNRDPGYHNTYQGWDGTEWHSYEIVGRGTTSSQRASISRSIRNLMNRGLLLRGNGCYFPGTTYLVLTPAGESIAKLLTLSRGQIQ